MNAFFNTASTGRLRSYDGIWKSLVQSEDSVGGPA
jgi:hypothetical protein